MRELEDHVERLAHVRKYVGKNTVVQENVICLWVLLIFCLPVETMV